MTKTVLITGGTRGIGAAISVAFQDAGYRVAASYAQNHEAAKAFTEQTGIAAYSWDASHHQACVDGIAKVEADIGPIDILINNAGITRDAMLHKLSEQDWYDVIHTNLNSCYHMSNAVLGGMRDRNFGRIISVSSINAQTGQLGQTNYSAAKAGILGFTKALARETARKNITVNAIAPGYIRTDMTSAIPEKIIDSIVAQIPVGRFGEPEEIARAALFLADEQSGFITGETLSINGGHHME